MFCKNCGSNLEDDARFCPNCGCKVDVVIEQNPDNKVEKQEKLDTDFSANEQEKTGDAIMPEVDINKEQAAEPKNERKAPIMNIEYIKQVAANAGNVGSVPNQSSMPNEPKNNKKSALPIVAIVVAICAIVVVVGGGLLGYRFVKERFMDGKATISEKDNLKDETLDEIEDNAATENAKEDAYNNTMSEEATAPSEPEEGSFDMIQDYNFTVCEASSELSPSDGNTYSAYNVADGNLATAWVEGVSGNGEGQWIKLSTADGSTRGVEFLIIYGGYQKSEGTYENNGRPASIMIVLDDGSYMSEELFYDGSHKACVDFGGLYYTSSIKIYINSVTPGNKYDDTAISEIEIYAYPESNDNSKFKTPEASSSTDYVLPDSDKRRLEDSEVMYLSEYELRIARNELYARHGRIFKDKALSDYFNSKPWYVGTIPAEQFNEDWLSDIEKYNRDLIKKYEER